MYSQTLISLVDQNPSISSGGEPSRYIPNLTRKFNMNEAGSLCVCGLPTSAVPCFIVSRTRHFPSGRRLQFSCVAASDTHTCIGKEGEMVRRCASNSPYSKSVKKSSHQYISHLSSRTRSQEEVAHRHHSASSCHRATCSSCGSSWMAPAATGSAVAAQTCHLSVRSLYRACAC